MSLDYPYVPNLARVLRAINPDVVHAHSHLFITTLVAIQTARSLDKPAVVTVHGIRVKRNPGIAALQEIYLQAVARRVFDWASLVTCLTRSDASEVARLSCSSSKIRLVQNAIDLEVFKPSQTNEDGKTVVWIGRYVAEKGLAHLVRAARIVVDREPAARFVLVGDGPLKHKVASMVQGLRLSDNVLLMKPVQRVAVPEILAQASVFALPSVSEGLPLALLEAMACGKAIVASDIPGNAEIIRNAENGLLFRAGSSSDLAEKVLVLLADARLRSRLGRRARGTVEERCSWHRVLGELDRIYDEARHAVHHMGVGRARGPHLVSAPKAPARSAWGGRMAHSSKVAYAL
jgi:glycosyltransferase involved in cell wall biosynthesis